MIVAIMQPYFFPYLGYFQLLDAADVFVIHDDVQYIKGGWVNRNRILVDGTPAWLVRPVVHAPHVLPINQRAYQNGNTASRLWRQVEGAYHAAPQFAQMRATIAPLLQLAEANVAAFNGHVVAELARKLGLRARIVVSSQMDKTPGLAGQERVVDLCKRLGATRYVNAIGGIGLYDRATFAAHGIELRFLRAELREYRQFDARHVPALSIIDAMMFNPLEDVRAMCSDYLLVEGGGA